MRNDYLWDGAGEPDPDVEKFERLLSPLRHHPGPLEQPVRRPRRWLSGLAAAAVVIVTLTAGWWMMSRRDTPVTPVAQETPAPPNTPSLAEAPPPEPFITAPQIETRPEERVGGGIERPKTPPQAPAVQVAVEEIAAEDVEYIPEYEEIVFLHTDDKGVDDQTASHMEDVQLLLRSFRNGGRHADIAYEKRRARDLLTHNRLLRRDAEAGGDNVAEELLSKAETYLLDIANLQDDTRREDVETIKTLMARTEIVAALQIYSGTR